MIFTDSPVKTKIIATLGPASASADQIRSLIRAGMSVARLNMSHGNREIHQETIHRLKQVMKDENQPVALLLDLCGPKIRIGTLPRPVLLNKNQVVELGPGESPETRLPVNTPEIARAVKAGDRILINDGLVELETLEVRKGIIRCRVGVPGEVSSGKGVNIPDSRLDIPAFTSKDEKDLWFGLKNGVDFIAMSFVSRAEDLQPVRRILKESRGQVPVIAKIERPAAVQNIDSILHVFDGIMIARGDLGVEVSAPEVPIIQKDFIRRANHAGKLVITATQMLESMVRNPRSTRAEVSDVSNAILDGTDLVMLSGETSVGKYPVGAVELMNRIARRTENSDLYRYNVSHSVDIVSNTRSIVCSAGRIAGELKARCILVYTLTGRTALLLSKYRPPCPVYALTPHKDALKRMSAYWGIQPRRIDFTRHTDAMLEEGERVMREEGIIGSGDLYITVAGITRIRGATNMLQISVAGQVSSD